MKEQLIKAMQYNQLIEVVYMAKGGKMTKRRVRVIKIVGNKFQAYCFSKGSIRTFIIENVLAMFPIVCQKKNVS
ncbi:WYL domain-containing protein [Rummeliibacillus stabekisii]|uniref:transcriptional regulator n=1 Tax=Rummeliibacillus stabekisii TaxID=241244 RepID=UPI0037186A8A